MLDVLKVILAAEEPHEVVDTRPGEVARNGHVLNAPHREVYAARARDIAQQFRAKRWTVLRL